MYIRIFPICLLLLTNVSAFGEDNQKETEEVYELSEEFELSTPEIQEYEKKIKKIKKFATFRNERRDLLSDISKMKSEIASLETTISSDNYEIEDQKYQLSMVESDIKSYTSSAEKDKNKIKEKEAELEKLKENGKKQNQTDEEYKWEIDDLEYDIDSLKYSISRVEQFKEEKTEIEDKIKTLEAKLKSDKDSLKIKKKTYEDSQDQLEMVENRINDLLIPTTAQNEFKLWVTFAFTSLVALVILGFFIVSAIDSSVRQAIFSSQSGIQFITLFSLVIAIILFGITDILGGKELAALLGGISGYILGRVSDRRDTNRVTGGKNVPDKADSRS